MVWSKYKVVHLNWLADRRHGDMATYLFGTSVAFHFPVKSRNWKWTSLRILKRLLRIRVMSPPSNYDERGNLTCKYHHKKASSRLGEWLHRVVIILVISWYTPGFYVYLAWSIIVMGSMARAQVRYQSINYSLVSIIVVDQRQVQCVHAHKPTNRHTISNWYKLTTTLSMACMLTRLLCKIIVLLYSTYTLGVSEQTFMVVHRINCSYFTNI